MKISSISAMVLGYHLLFELVLNGMFFTPFLVFFLPRLGKRFVLLLFALQVGELSGFYLLRRDLCISAGNAILGALGRSALYAEYDLMMFLFFVLYTLLSYGLSLGFVKVFKIRKRVGVKG